ncbi:MAG: TauD/TfdA family dioxygenase [Immundisolibacteraceae bacterium]|nr:TauD/TfdA family dioxygenase [Immundisolibacteraceae bacterium]
MEQIQSLEGPAVWSGNDFNSDGEWIYHFSDAAIADIDQAIKRIREQQITLGDITAGDFDLPALTTELQQMKQILTEGRGFVMLKGLLIDKYSDQEFEIILYGIGTHLGIGVSQSHIGDRIGQVKDVGGVGRYYTAGGPIEVHMDPVDITGLLCLRQAKLGGESWIMSAGHVHNLLLEESAEHLEVLYRGFHYGGTQGSKIEFRTPHRLPVFANPESGPVCFYLPAAILGWSDLPSSDLNELEIEALEHFNGIALREQVYLKMDLQPGDIQFLNNRKLLHARSDYQDHEEPERARHLLRLWLMAPEWPALPEQMNFLPTTDRAGGGIAKSETP